MTKSVRRWILPPVAAASLLLMAAGSALADAKSTVSVFNEDGTPAGSSVCGFFFEFSAVAGDESGAWELRDASGAAVEAGSYSVTASSGDRVPDDGSLSLANGTYTLLWDDEDRIDNSNSELDIVVECEASTATPGAPATMMPTPTFNASVAAETEFVASAAPNVTQPATNTLDGSSSPDQAAWTVALLAILGLTGLLLALTPRTRSGRR